MSMMSIKKTVRYITSIIIFVFFNVLNSIAVDLANGDIKSIEDSLNIYFAKISVERSDIVKEELNENILQLFRKAFENENSFDYNFGTLKNVGIITSKDQKLRIITWNLPYNDRTHKYFGFIQYKKSKKDLVTSELNDRSDEIEKPELNILNKSNWYGALYYKIIENKFRGNSYYTLLGADLNDLLTKKKIVEILSFDSKGNPTFGKKVFKNQRQSFTRVIFEYSAQVNMALTYDEEKEMIVYDHLSPSKPSLQGQFEFYGPDFSYDGLKFERGIWNSYPDIDVRNFNID